MKEFDFIEKIKPAYYRNASLIKGIGDDGAVIRPPNGYELVIASDTMVENIHFSFRYMSLSDIGYRVLAANLSDLAAMGAKPLYYAVNMAVPSRFTDEMLVELYEGMDELAKSHKIDLIGGDTVTANDLTITVSVYGTVLPSRIRLRSHSKPGDVVFVTGNLGEAIYGFEELQSDASLEGYFIDRHKRPFPRTYFTDVSMSIGRLALNDVSDGISSELYEIAEASQVTIDVEWSRLPVHKKMQMIEEEQLKSYILAGGEDFELLGTCAEDDWNRIKELCEDKIKLTPIGKSMNHTKEPKVYLTNKQGRSVLQKSGYAHG